MALTPANNDSFIREVDDAVRADRMQSFLARYGIATVLAMLVGLAALGGWLWLQNRNVESSGAMGRDLATALETFTAGRPKAAAQALAPLTRQGTPNYQVLAMMMQGNAALGEENTAAAADKFKAAAGVADADASLRDIALIRQSLADFDTVPPATIIGRLAPLVARGGPAFASAAELTALAQLKQGNDRAAAGLFGRIAAAPDAADSLKKRALQMAGMLRAPRDAGAALQAPMPAQPTVAAPAAGAQPVRSGE